MSVDDPSCGSVLTCEILSYYLCKSGDAQATKPRLHCIDFKTTLIM